MTSVRNLLQLSNGNNLILILLVLTFTSCSSTKKSTARTKKPPKKERPQKVRLNKNNKDRNEKGGIKPIEKDDSATVESEMDDKTVIDTDDIFIKESVYDVTFLAPFDTKRSSPSELSDDRFLQYYGGMVMAAEDLGEIGAKFVLNVADTKNQPINEVLNNYTSSDTDVIIGPYDRKSLKYAIGFGTRQKIPIVSPWQSLNGVDNPTDYYVQLVPYLTEYYYSLISHISEKYDKSDVYIVGRKSDKKDVKRIAGFQNLAKAYFKVNDQKPLHEVYVEMSDLEGEEAVFLPHMQNKEKTVFLIPHWSGSDYEFVYNLLRRISLEKSLNEVIIYGMFSMLDNPNITFELYNTLNIHVATPSYIDQEKYEVKRFKRDFLELFGTLPSEDAYEGYDDFMFIGNGLYKYGKQFQYHLEKENDLLLQSSYKINRVYKDDRFDKIQYFENKHVDLIELKENGFNRVE